MSKKWFVLGLLVIVMIIGGGLAFGQSNLDPMCTPVPTYPLGTNPKFTVCSDGDSLTIHSSHNNDWELGVVVETESGVQYTLTDSPVCSDHQGCLYEFTLPTNIKRFSIHGIYQPNDQTTDWMPSLEVCTETGNPWWIPQQHNTFLPIIQNP